MTPLYVPGITGDARVIEGAYGKIRRQLELDMGPGPQLTPDREPVDAARRG